MHDEEFEYAAHEVSPFTWCWQINRPGIRTGRVVYMYFFYSVPALTVEKLCVNFP